MTQPRSIQVLFAAAAITPIIKPQTPLEERVKILSQYLAPAPGRIIEVNPIDLRESQGSGKDLGLLSGSIDISPPKGQCFTVTKARHLPDVEVCKKKSLKWSLQDLDRDSTSLTWSIKTGPDDFGTSISWHTPYVIAKVLPPNTNFYEMNSRPVFFKSCVPTIPRDDGTLRKITLTTFDDKRWIIRFPDKDTLMEKKNDKSKDETSKDEKSSPSADDEASEVWTINTGRTFEMNVGNFISDGSMPPGKKGTCRYVYDILPGDNSRGRIECHHTDQYLYVYLVTSCMQSIIPK